jgi:hypothetical protein
MTVAGRLEGADLVDLDGLREALGSPDRLDYVIEHLVDLLPRGSRERAAAWTRDERDL